VTILLQRGPRRPRKARGCRLAAGGIGVVLLVAGCAWRSGERARPGLREREVAVRVAALMAEHPLYAELSRLSQASGWLRWGPTEQPARAPDWLRPGPQELSVGPSLDVLEPFGGLAMTPEGMRQELDEAVGGVRAAVADQVAAQREAIRERLERQAAGAQGARPVSPEEAQALARRVEGSYEGALADSAWPTEARESVAAETAAALAEAEREARRLQQQAETARREAFAEEMARLSGRAGDFVGAAEETARAMVEAESRRSGEFAEPGMPDVTVATTAKGSPEAAEAADRLWEAAHAAWARAAREHQQQLIMARERLLHDIHESTKAAVTLLAAERGLKVGGWVAGPLPDATAELRRPLRSYWAAGRTRELATQQSP